MKTRSFRKQAAIKSGVMKSMNRNHSSLICFLFVAFITGCTRSTPGDASPTALKEYKWRPIASKPAAQLPTDQKVSSRGATFGSGKNIISWGDIVSGNATNIGAIYDADTNSWSQISNVNAPTPRTLFASASSGAELIIWGGRTAGGDFTYNDGGIYDLATGTWSSMSTANSPTARFAANSVWTGSQFIVYGGQQDSTVDTLADGSVYTLATDAWTEMNTVNAPTARRYSSAVWTGTEMIIWGGVEFPACNSCSHPSPLNSGARYNPTTDTWSSVSTVGAPSPRAGHVAIWTGSKMIIWGGGDIWVGSFLNDGAAYDPTTDTWTPVNDTNAPSARGDAGFVWTGSKLLVFGGRNYTNSYLNSGAAYDPTADEWESLPSEGSPSERAGSTLIWTGSSLYVVGGSPAPDGSADVGGCLSEYDVPDSPAPFIPSTPAPLASSWTSRSLPHQIPWSSIAYGNGKFVALSDATSMGGGGGSTLAATSIDGASWTAVTLPSSNIWRSATYGNGVFVAVSLDGSAAASSNGTTWTGSTIGGNDHWTAVTYGNGNFVAVSGNGWPGDAKAATSSDGVSWTQHSIPDGQWSSVTYGNGMFVAIAGGPSSTALTSTDGITWTQRNLPESNWWSSVTYGNGTFVATANPGASSVAATSADGIAWTKRTMSSVQSWQSVTFGNGTFIALAYNSNVIATSNDGISWLQKPISEKTWWRGLAFGGGVFVAVAGMGSDGGGIVATTTQP